VSSIRVNGTEQPFVAGESVATLVVRLGREPQLIAVERNGEVVPRRTWGEVAVAVGDRFEIVQFVQGG
jgi:thiamine biosynthesis protein ThiS